MFSSLQVQNVEVDSLIPMKVQLKDNRIFKAKRSAWKLCERY